MKTCRLSNNQQRSTVQQQELLFIHTYIHIKFMMTITCTTASVEQALSIEIEVDASPRHEVKYVITKYSACLTVHRLVTALLASRAAEQQTPKTCAFDAHISEHCSWTEIASGHRVGAVSTRQRCGCFVINQCNTRREMLLLPVPNHPQLETCSDSVRYLISVNTEYLRHKGAWNNTEANPLDSPQTESKYLDHFTPA